MNNLANIFAAFLFGFGLGGAAFLIYIYYKIQKTKKQLGFINDMD